MLIRRSGYIYIEDGADVNIGLSYAIGVSALLLCGGIYVAFGSELTLDVNAPDFNPVVFALPLLAFIGLYYLGRGALDQARSRKFGKSVLEIPDSGPRMGRSFAGKIYGPQIDPEDRRCRIAMRFVETFESGERGASSRKERENVRWESEIPADAGASQFQDGIPFSFVLPPLQELRRQIDDSSSVKKRATVHVSIPGMKDRTFAHNALPDRVHWIVEINARTQGIDYHAAFAIRVEERVPVN